MTVDSTGNMSRQRTYTLTTGEEKIDLSEKNLGPADVALVATWLQRPEVIAALNSVVLDGCEITGTKIKDKGYSVEKIEQVDANLSGFTSLCTSLKSSEIQSLSLQKCYLGPEALSMLADAIQFMAALNSVNFSGNPIGNPIPTGVPVKKGAFASDSTGRWGELTRDPDGDGDIKLKWIDDGKESSYIKANTLRAVLASRDEIEPFSENYDHIKLLGEAISASKINDVTLANCMFTSATLATFVESVRWAEAALTKLDLRENWALDEVALAELRAAAPKTCRIVADRD
jgi:hypothetical protein